MSDLDTFKTQFENWVLKDIRIVLKLEDGQDNTLSPDRSAFIHRRPLTAAIILICCAIDCLARFRYGKLNNGVGVSFKDFIRTYFDSDTTVSGKSYDDEKVYIGLRNALVHGYSLSKDMGLVHQTDKDHLEVVDGRVIIDVFSLYFDLEKAYEKYRSELVSGQHLQEFDDRWQVFPVLQYMPDENIKGVR